MSLWVKCDNCQATAEITGQYIPNGWRPDVLMKRSAYGVLTNDVEHGPHHCPDCIRVGEAARRAALEKRKPTEVTA